jgi:hypothetical protein
MTKNFVLFCLLGLLLSSCSKSLQHAEKSLEGLWNINKITTLHGKAINLGVSIDSTTVETGSLGMAQFNDMVALRYTSKFQTVDLTDQFNLTKTSVNAGFTKVDEFNMVIQSQRYKIFFGDGTSGSTKNARSIEMRSNEDFKLGNKSILLQLLKK